MSRPLPPDAIAAAFRDACLIELEALKPGNVHRFADGHRMTVTDFEQSAMAAAPIIARDWLTVGTRIRFAVEATITEVGQNTNLGIVLLAAPLAQAALDGAGGSLAERVAHVLAALTIDDAREAYAAIRHARPGGLGEASRHDVASEPEVTLLEAMREAESRDRIAWNYAHDFADIFTRGLPRLQESSSAGSRAPLAARRVYLGFLGNLPDTLIERKHGRAAAIQVAEEARSFSHREETGEDLEAALLEFDRSLKGRGYNPGTSADLTVATLFAAALIELETED